jgi:hypothetical protein
MKKRSNAAKSRLVILLGAGSTTHAGAPSTAEITQHVRDLRLKSGVIKTIVERLEAQCPSENLNFETVVYAIEELDDYLLRSQRPDAGRLVGGVLSAFTSLSEACGNLKTEGLRLAVLQSIADFVWAKTKDASAAELGGFLERLREHFRLTVFTLNYDNIVDRAGNWFDGFTDAQGTGGARHWRFNASAFRARFHREAEALAHLHGSVQFGYGGGVPDIVKYSDAGDALSSLRERPANAAPPIISGFDKETKVARTPVPFGYYYNAFAEAISETPRLLVAGYGGMDPHVSIWFGEFVRALGELNRAGAASENRGRVAWIDKNNPAKDWPSPSFLPIETCFPPADEATIDRIVEHLL